ncbi:chaperone TorD involved in molybdoenzyme TorA maturation [Desulfonatronum thiosulfatophilum]|uniref:Chaperone TorD involved in molybdoenzyme TorA maturation n=1 Tax=Desulfonatronum thiosulfatophilum TaxID=617002 RepID=A0A1G6C6P2_9BACT|nr:molecular chaperone TorD family protein [Desulfonatronum thiosulfatophilum]SDB28555.1 chaperone TorD involved in molybdoenzyme TorA maturation [Desulfonatronum thiosulfatophilum]
MNNIDSDLELKSLLWGLEAVSWIFRGADGGQWRSAGQDCLPGLAGVLLFLESRGLVENDVLDKAEGIHAMVAGVAAEPTMDPEDLEAEYVRLFVNRLGGLGVPLCQSSYGEDGLLMGAAAEDMRRRLGRAGLQVSDALPPDHISIEIGCLMSLLSSRFASDHPRIPHDDSASLFAVQVLLPWVGELEARMRQAEAHDLFQVAAATLTAMVRHISAQGDHFPVEQQA